MTDTADAPVLSLVVSTIGRPIALERLLLSLVASSSALRCEVVVVDQSDDGRCRELAESRTWPFPVKTAVSARGVSLGRNTGLRLASAPLVGFPDDDAWYPPTTLARVVELLQTDPDLAGVCGRQTGPDGVPSMLRWQSAPGPVTRRNFLHTSIMSTMFFRRSWLDRTGPFDERMGVGAPGWYGACEESDLLLRVLEAHGRVDYVPDLLVLSQETRDDENDAFVRKMLLYGCGQGHLWRKRGLSRSLLAYYLSRKVAAAAVRAARGERTLARADLAWLQGNLSGLRDVPPRALAHLAP